ncbi:hypothetical protein [Micromonospora sp. NPDC007230]|uniref:hypothetical protein n=1 Tax=Micromonospora sp. NPDC007230 TaxID=3364237 RepID=UPI0036C9B34D
MRQHLMPDGDPLADHDNPTPPLLSGVTALVAGNGGSGRAHDLAATRPAACAGLVTSTRSAASNRAAQR